MKKTTTKIKAGAKRRSVKHRKSLVDSPVNLPELAERECPKAPAGWRFLADEAVVKFGDRFCIAAHLTIGAYTEVKENPLQQGFFVKTGRTVAEINELAGKDGTHFYIIRQIEGPSKPVTKADVEFIKFAAKIPSTGKDLEVRLFPDDSLVIGGSGIPESSFLRLSAEASRALAAILHLIQSAE